MFYYKGKVYIEKVDSSKRKNNLNKSFREFTSKKNISLSPQPIEASPSPPPAPVYKINSMNDDEQLRDALKHEKGWRNKIRQIAKKVVFEPIPDLEQPKAPPVLPSILQNTMFNQQIVIDNALNINNERKMIIYGEQPPQLDISILSTNYRQQLDQMLEGDYVSIECISQDLTLIIQENQAILYEQLTPLIQEDIELNDKFKIHPFFSIPNTQYIIKLFYDIERQQLFILELHKSEKKMRFRQIKVVYSYQSYYCKEYNLFLIIILNTDQQNLGFFTLDENNDSPFLDPILVKTYDETIQSFSKVGNCLNINHAKGIIIEEFFSICSVISKKINSGKYIDQRNDILIVVDQQSSSKKPIKDKKKVELSDSSSGEDDMDIESSRFIKQKSHQQIMEFLANNNNKSIFDYSKNDSESNSNQSTSASSDGQQSLSKIDLFKQDLNAQLIESKEPSVTSSISNSNFNQSNINQSVKQSNTKSTVRSKSNPQNKNKNDLSKKQQSTKKEMNQSQLLNKSKVEKDKKTTNTMTTKKRPVSADIQKKNISNTNKQQPTKMRSISSKSSTSNIQTINVDQPDKSKILLEIEEDDLFPDDPPKQIPKCAVKEKQQNNLQQLQTNQLDSYQQKVSQILKEYNSNLILNRSNQQPIIKLNIKKINQPNQIVATNNKSETIQKEKVQIDISSGSVSIQEIKQKQIPNYNDITIQSFNNEEYEIDNNLFPDSPIKTSKSNEGSTKQNKKEEQNNKTAQNLIIPPQKNQKNKLQEQKSELKNEEQISIRSSIMIGTKKMQLVKIFKKEDITANINKILSKNIEKPVVPSNLSDDKMIEETIDQEDFNENQDLLQNQILEEQDLNQTMNNISSKDCNQGKKKIIIINKQTKDQNNKEYYDSMNTNNTHKYLKSEQIQQNQQRDQNQSFACLENDMTPSSDKQQFSESLNRKKQNLQSYYKSKSRDEDIDFDKDQTNDDLNNNQKHLDKLSINSDEKTDQLKKHFDLQELDKKYAKFFKKDSTHQDFSEYIYDDIEEVNAADDEREDEEDDYIEPIYYNEIPLIQQQQTNFIQQQECNENLNNRLNQLFLQQTQQQEMMEFQNQFRPICNLNIQNLQQYQTFTNQMFMQCQQQHQFQFSNPVSQGYCPPVQINYSYARIEPQNLIGDSQKPQQTLCNFNKKRKLSDFEIAKIELKKYQQMQEVIN